MVNSAIDTAIRLKNGYMSKRETIEMPYSKYREQILKKLKEIGFITEYEVTGELVMKSITVKLQYNDGVPALTDVKIVSKPGARMYSEARTLRPVINNMGFSILSTSKGIMTNKEARKAHVGGELLFKIW